jgi:protein-L-isoaspartate O-methyltransferase
MAIQLHRSVAVECALVCTQAETGAAPEDLVELAEAMVSTDEGAAALLGHADVREGHRVVIFDSNYGQLAFAANRVVGPTGQVAVVEGHDIVATFLRDRWASMGLDPRLIHRAPAADLTQYAFDRVLVTAMSRALPGSALRSLADGGTLFGVLGGTMARRAMVASRDGGAIVGRFIGSAAALVPTGIAMAAAESDRKRQQPVGQLSSTDWVAVRRTARFGPADLRMDSDFVWYLQLKVGAGKMCRWVKEGDYWLIQELGDRFAGDRLEFRVVEGGIQAKHRDAGGLLYLMEGLYDVWRSLGRPGSDRCEYRAGADGSQEVVVRGGDGDEERVVLDAEPW